MFKWKFMSKRLIFIWVKMYARKTYFYFRNTLERLCDKVWHPIGGLYCGNFKQDCRRDLYFYWLLPTLNSWSSDTLLLHHWSGPLTLCLFRNLLGPNIGIALHRGAIAPMVGGKFEIWNYLLSNLFTLFIIIIIRCNPIFSSLKFLFYISSL